MTSTTARALSTCREARVLWELRALDAESAVRRDLEISRARTSTPTIEIARQLAIDSPADLSSPLLWLAIGAAAILGGVVGVAIGRL